MSNKKLVTNENMELFFSKPNIEEKASKFFESRQKNKESASSSNITVKSKNQKKRNEEIKKFFKKGLNESKETLKMRSNIINSQKKVLTSIYKLEKQLETETKPNIRKNIENTIIKAKDYLNQLNKKIKMTKSEINDIIRKHKENENRRVEQELNDLRKNLEVIHSSSNNLSFSNSLTTKSNSSSSNNLSSLRTKSSSSSSSSLSSNSNSNSNSNKKSIIKWYKVKELIKSGLKKKITQGFSLGDSIYINYYDKYLLSNKNDNTFVNNVVNIETKKYENKKQKSVNMTK